MEVKILILLAIGSMILGGCERRAANEPQRNPGSFFPSYPCTLCADGTQYCSDVVKPSC